MRAHVAVVARINHNDRRRCSKNARLVPKLHSGPAARKATMTTAK
jgi:hypothetical protein